MSEQTVAWLMMGIGTAQVLLLLAMLTTLRDQEVQKPSLRSRIGDTMYKFLGVIMTALDTALARFTAFATGVLAQLRGAKEANDAQTGKLAELQVALDTALADDAADKAAINALQAEVSTLQDEVAAKINAAVDSLENAPVVEVVEEPVVEVVEEPVVEVVEEPVVEEPVVEEVTEPVVEEPVEVPGDEVSVVEDTPVVVDETGTTPVE